MSDNRLNLVELERKFLSWVDWTKVSGEDSCWIYTSKVGYTGYCQFQIGRTPFKRKAILVGAHRFSYWLFNNYCLVPIHQLKIICHRCDNPSCVNPKHLFEGTQEDNLRDSVLKNRTGKLTKENVEEILKLRKAGHLLKDIGRKFNIGARHTGQIVHGERYGAYNLH